MSGFVSPNYNFLSTDDVKSPAQFGNEWAELRSRVLQNQQLAGEQAAGNALARSTDAQGNVDIPHAVGLIANDPVASRAMLKTFGNLQTTQQTQLGNINTRYTQAGRWGASLVNNPSDENVQAIATDMRNKGVPEAQIQAEIGTIQGMSPAQRQQYGIQHIIGSLDASDRLHNTVGTAGVARMPQGDIPYVQAPAWQGGGVQPAPGGVTAGGSPSEGMTLVQTKILQPDGTYKTVGIPRMYLPGWQGGTPTSGGGGAANPPNTPAPGSAIPPPPNAPPGTPAGRVRPPDGSPLLKQPTPSAAPPPATPAPQAPAPGPAPGPAPAPQQPGSDKVAGPGAPSPQPAPQPSGQPSGAPSGSPVVNTPAGPGVLTAEPQGQPESVAADVALFKKDQAALPDWQRQDRNLAIAHEALKLTQSGRNQDTLNGFYSLLSGMNMLPPGYTKDMANFEVFKKATERVVQQVGNAGGTDASRALAAASNPGVEYSKPANLEILRNDIGINRQQMAAVKAEDQSGTGAGYTGRRGNVITNTDPRGFVWNLYTPQEQAKINAEVAKAGPAAEAKLHRAIGMAARLGLDRTPGETAPGPNG